MQIESVAASLKLFHEFVCSKKSWVGAQIEGVAESLKLLHECTNTYCIQMSWPIYPTNFNLIFTLADSSRDAGCEHVWLHRSWRCCKAKHWNVQAVAAPLQTPITAQGVKTLFMPWAKITPTGICRIWVWHMVVNMTDKFKEQVMNVNLRVTKNKTHRRQNSEGSKGNIRSPVF